MRSVRLHLRVPLLLSASLALCPAVDAQSFVNIDRFPPAMRNFEWRPDDQPLACAVSSLRPALNFGFRFQAGYAVSIPMNQYRGKGHRWTVLMRVTPESGKPVYFVSRYRLPEVPKT